ncbi:MAG: potassium transporter [Epsilonproteobacteria bacterium]|nr:potassium transporter [Campylobacterota bacterium]
MDIIIAGAGRVGFRLAKTLCIKHNITVIDKNEDALNRLQESIDILAITGNIEDPKTYDVLVDKEYDLFVAVTDVDEVNIISTLIADETIQVKGKIIRLRNDFFSKSSIGEKLGITASVFPFFSSANSVEALLEFPKANNVKRFSEFPQKLISVRAKSSVASEEINSSTLRIIGIERDKDFFIPSSYENIQKGDLVYLFGEVNEIKEICASIDPQMPKEIKNIAIFGADTLGVEIAQIISENSDINIKLIEKDLNKCQKASEILQENVAVINSKYGDYQLFKEEGLKNADMLIASTKNDEENIIKCLEAKEFGIKKVVAINNDTEHYSLMHKLGIIAVRGPKMNAYYSILEKIGSSELVSQRQFCGGKGVLMIRKVAKDSLKQQKPKPLKDKNTISFVLSGDKIYDLQDCDEIKEKDVIVIFGTNEKEEEMSKWINSL